jgi:hypothetical protein
MAKRQCRVNLNLTTTAITTAQSSSAVMTTPLLTRNAFDEENQDDFDEGRRTRRSRNSTGVKEEFLAPVLDDDEDSAVAAAAKKNEANILVIVFLGLVVIGLGNKVFNKLMTIPMYNYPNFLNLLTSFVFIPVCFAYIIPMAHYNKIPQEQFNVPKKSFAIMGALDALAGM